MMSRVESRELDVDHTVLLVVDIVSCVCRVWLGRMPALLAFLCFGESECNPCG